MADLNSISITGRLTRDAERKSFGDKGNPYVQFDIANNTGYGSYAKTNYFKVMVIGKSSENVLPYLKKGQMVSLTGSIELNKWTNAQGDTQTEWRITTMNINLISSSSKESNPLSNLPDQYPSLPDGDIDF